MSNNIRTVSNELFRLGNDSKLYITPFDVKVGSATKEVECKNEGIATYNWFTVFLIRVVNSVFCKCFDWVTSIKLADQRVVHISKSDFEKWKKDKITQGYVIDSHLTAAEEIINAYCDAKYNKEANILLNEANTILNAGVYSKDNAARLSVIEKQVSAIPRPTSFPSKRVSVFKDLSEYPMAPVEYDRLKRNLESSDYVLRRSNEDIQKLGSYADQSTAKKVQAALKTVIATLKPVDEKLKSEEEIFTVLDQKELDSYFGDHTIDHLRNRQNLIFKDDKQLQNRIKEYDPQGTMPENERIKQIFAHHRETWLAEICFSFTYRCPYDPVDLLMKNALEKDEKAIKDKLEKEIGQASEHLKKGELAQAIGVYEKAIANVPEQFVEKYKGELENLKKFDVWIKAKGIGIDVTLEKQNAEFKQKVETLGKIISTDLKGLPAVYSEDITKLKKIRDCLEAVDLNFGLTNRQDFNVTIPPNTDEGQLKAFKAALPPESNGLIEKFKKHATMNVLTQVADQVLQKTLEFKTAAEKAQESKRLALEAFAKHDIDGAFKIIEEARKAASDWKIVSDKLSASNELISWLKEIKDKDQKMFGEMLAFQQLPENEQLSKLAEMQERFSKKTEAMTVIKSTASMNAARGYKSLFYHWLDLFNYAISESIKVFVFKTKNKDTQRQFPLDIIDYCEREMRYKKRSYGLIGHFQLKDICTYDIKNWETESRKVRLCISEDVDLEKMGEGWKKAYDYIQLNRLIDSSFQDYELQLPRMEPFFKMEEEWGFSDIAYFTKSFSTTEYDYFKIRFTIDKDKLISKFEELEKSLFHEILNCTSANPSKISHQNMELVQEIANLFGQKNNWRLPKERFSNISEQIKENTRKSIEGNTQLREHHPNFFKDGKKLNEFDEKLHLDFVTSLDGWNKLSENERNGPKGIEAKKAVILALAKFWNDFSSRFFEFYFVTKYKSADQSK